MLNVALDMAALEGRTVTEAHARHCRENGHATHRVNGLPTGHCPRCGAGVQELHGPVSDLQVGDLVLTHGMRVVLDQEPTIYLHNANTPRERTVYAWNGRVANHDEVVGAGHVPASFIADGRWTIQGNDGYRVTYVRAV